MTSEFSRFLLHKDRLFPGATLVRNEEATKAGLGKRGARAVATLLATTDRDCITSLEVQEETGVSLQKHTDRILGSELVQTVMAEGGWTFVRGRGRGNLSRFVRATEHQGMDLTLAA